MYGERKEIMTRREMNLRVFERKKVPGVLFQPRIEWWYQYNKTRGTLPFKYQEMDLLELFNDLDASIRYFSCLTGLPWAVGVKYSKKVKIKEKIKGEKKFLIYTTARGELIEELKLSSDGAF